MNLVKIMAVAYQLLPIINAAITQVEDENNKAKDEGSVGLSSKAKLQYAKEVIEVFYNAANPAVAFKDLVGAIEKIITLIVAYRNTADVLKKKST